MIPGMFPAGAAGPFKVTAISLANTTFNATTGGSGASVTVPTVARGDLLVLSDFATLIGGNPTPVLQSGWTSAIMTSSLSARRTHIQFKVADGSESGAVLTCMAGNNSQGILAHFSANAPIVAAAAGSANEGTENTTGITQVVAASGGAAPLVVVAAWGAPGAIDPRGMTPAKDGEVGSNVGTTEHWLAWKIYNASPANVTVSMEDESAFNQLVSAYIACT